MPADDQLIVLVGAAGDLMTRHLLPALRQLDEQGTLDGTRFLGVDRVEPAAFHEATRAALADSPDLRARIEYRRADVTSHTRLPELDDASLVYVALPPRLLAS